MISKIIPIMFLSIISVCFTPSSLLAQDNSSNKSLAVLQEEIQIVWEGAFVAAQASEDAIVSEKVQKLEQLRDAAGLESLADYSIELLGQGESRYIKGDREAAIFYLTMANNLSPNSPRVAFRSLRLVQVTKGLSKVLGVAFSSLIASFSYPELLLKFSQSTIYPLLWACTLGLFLSFLILFLYHMPDILRSIAQQLPGSLRGYFAPLITFVILLAPCFLGPIVCLAVWAILCLLLLPQRRWMAFIAGSIICLWGVAIPLRENVGKWLSDPDIQTMLRVTSDELGRDDLAALQSLTAKRPDDGVAWYLYAQTLKRAGLFDRADTAFLKAEELMGGRQGLTLAERGTIAFLKGDSRKAIALFEKAETMGLDSPALYFNWSKAAFDRLDTETSRRYMVMAREKDQVLVTRLQALEQVEGLRSQRAMADVDLPFAVVLDSALIPYAEVVERVDEVADALVPGFTVTKLTGLGILVLLLSLFVKGRGTKRYSTYYHSYEHSFILYAFMTLLPGGLWVRSGRPALTFMSAALGILLLLPVMGWPPEVKPVVDLIPGFISLYCSFLCIMFLALAYVAYQTSEAS